MNHNPSITLEDPSWEIKGKGMFSRELIFSLWTPVAVKAGEQVNSFLKISSLVLLSIGEVNVFYSVTLKLVVYALNSAYKTYHICSKLSICIYGMLQSSMKHSMHVWVWNNSELTNDVINGYAHIFSSWLGLHR